MARETAQLKRLRRYWDKHSPTYDDRMGWMERQFFSDTRAWICKQAYGDVLEVGIGTGLNLDHYPADVAITGIDLSPAMLAHAKSRAKALGRHPHLITGDAQTLEFGDESFDTVVSTFTLCSIPDERLAIDEMARVLRPGGRLLLADHVASTKAWLRAAQWIVDLGSVPIAGEHFRRRPYDLLADAGLVIGRHDRFKYGVIERLAAHRPK